MILFKASRVCFKSICRQFVLLCQDMLQIFISKIPKLITLSLNHYNNYGRTDCTVSVFGVKPKSMRHIYETICLLKSTKMHCTVKCITNDQKKNIFHVAVI